MLRCPCAHAALRRLCGHTRKTPQPPQRKRLLALADTHTGYTHDSIGHALAVIDQLGRQSGLYDTFIRTDSQWITKQPIPLPARNTKNLNDFDAVFLFISGEGDWTDQQKRDFVSFVKEDGKGRRRRAHRQRGVLPVGGIRRDDGRVLRQSSLGHLRRTRRRRCAGLSGDAPFRAVTSPGAKSFTCCARSRTRARRCGCSRTSMPRTSTSSIPNYHRKDADLPVALARTYGKGRTFWSNFGHFAETWDDPDIQKMYLEAIKWAMGLTPGDATPSKTLKR